MVYEAPFSPSLQAMDLAAPVQEDKHCSPIESDASPSLLWVGFDNGTAIQKAEMRWARWRSCSVEFLTFDELLAWLKQVPSKPEGAQRMLSMIQPFRTEVQNRNKPIGRFCHENKSSDKSLIRLEAALSGSHRG
jgi:hypothetical protein